MWSWGSSSTGGNGMDQTFMTATQMSFSHYDWWRSTDNGGTMFTQHQMEKFLKLFK